MDPWESGGDSTRVLLRHHISISQFDGLIAQDLDPIDRVGSCSRLTGSRSRVVTTNPVETIDPADPGPRYYLHIGLANLGVAYDIRHVKSVKLAWSRWVCAHMYGQPCGSVVSASSNQ